MGSQPDGGAAASCKPSPRTSEDLTPRIDLLRQTLEVPSGAPTQQVVKTADLFKRFQGICGQCHVSIATSGFQATESTFATVFDRTRLARIESDNPSFAMPPEGKAFSSRAPDDPVVQLAKLLEAWLDQGRPVDMFTVADSSSAGAGKESGSYAYTTLTNMGDCIPAKNIYAASPSSEMDAKDTFFANATSLPADLADTDLTSFDTGALAANGVIAFRPTYALWSAGSRKLRFVRVPKGTSIKFDKDKQTFDIPPNTRFYKTFFRQVVDSAGRTSYRKMETRLIVARPDGLDTDGKTPKPTALFGTYIWSDDEMSARLRETPYRDGTGFADLTATYQTNEIEYHDLVANLPPGTGSLASKVDAELRDPRHLGLVQHYAVPGSLRCFQCHQGSATHNFVLGFFPLQIAQRAAGTGGTYDAAGADELDQLQRFIDYGLITGMATPADVVKLEDSQEKKPRTDGELKAQGYMLGNCSHCHNPRGFPSLAKPELATALNFLPGSADGAGIFGFDFERMSPLRQRGANQDIPVPYITPSLRDYPVADRDLRRVDNGVSIEPSSDASNPHEVTWSPKYDLSLFGPTSCMSDNPITRSYCGQRKNGYPFVAAPWRSIIYRNVDTPFPYFDDYVPFPHMPMNTAGFDCRAPRIMGDWMVGLPAQLKPQYQGLSEDAIPVPRPDGTYFPYIDAAQPYQEVKPGEDGYEIAVANAKARLEEYHSSSRYPYCQDALSPDIIDPVGPPGTPNGSPHEPTQFYPIPLQFLAGAAALADPNHPGQIIQPAIGVPYHSEWFDYDPTDPPPPWGPRRVEWERILVEGLPDTSLPAGKTSDDADPAHPDDPHPLATARRRLIAALQTAELTKELRAYGTTPIPYGLWQAKPECEAKLMGQKKVSDLAPSEIPAWLAAMQPPPSPDARVYYAAPGFALFRHVCFNCHGAKADGKGLQGDALASASEGRTRPANLSGGLLGPAQMPGANLLRVFGQGTDDPETADRWGSRYMAWMTLGGTLQLIPQDVVNQVQATRILGTRREHLQFLPAESAGVSANMLNLAKGLCAEALPDTSALHNSAAFLQNGPESGDFPLITDTKQSAFIRTNGDWEMWMNLCSRFNRPVVRVYGADLTTNGTKPAAQLKAIYYADGDGKGNFAYPTDKPVWDHNRKVRPTGGVTPDNYFASCFQGHTALPGEPGSPVAGSDAYREAYPNLSIPDCPAEFLQQRKALMSLSEQSANRTTEQVDAVKEWTLKGAINAAMTVFTFLKAADLANNHPLPLYYNECQRLP